MVEQPNHVVAANYAGVFLSMAFCALAGHLSRNHGVANETLACMVLATVGILAVVGKIVTFLLSVISAFWFDEKKKQETVDSLCADITDPLGFWLLNGKRLDLTGFMDSHPGGRRVISWTRGRDISELVLFSHSLSPFAIAEIAEQKYLHPDQSNVPANRPLLTSAFYPTLATRIREFYASKGKLSAHKMPLHMLALRTLVLLPFTIFVGWRWLNADWWACFSLGPLYWLVASFSTHDGLHQAISNRPWINVVGGWIGSLWTDPYLWFIQHTVGHHVSTNIHGKDPDLEHFDKMELRFGIRISEEQASVSEKTIFASTMLNTAFLASMTTASLSVWNVIDIVTTGLFKVVKLGPAFYGEYWIEFLLLRSILPTLFIIQWSNNPSVALLLCAIPCAMHGITFFVFTQVSHVPLVNELNKSDDWAISQVNMACDYAVNSRLWSLLSIGLNNQALHHLFPQISSDRLLELQPIFQRTCDEFGVKRVLESTLWGAITRYWAHILRLNGKKSPPNSTPLLGLPEKIETATN